MKQLSGTYIFREITDTRELLAAFQLRHETYTATPGLRYLLKHQHARLDIDGFDAFARHYGIFTKGKMVGYVRVIWHEENTSNASKIEHICVNHGISTPEYPDRLYVEKDFVETSNIDKIPKSNPSISICEPGRFIILPAYRSAGLAQFAIESVMTAICAQAINPVGIIDCRRHHRAMYERNGFTWLAEQDEPGVPGNPWNLLMISRDGVAARLPDIDARIRRFREQGRLTQRLGSVDWVALAYVPMLLRRWRRKVAGNFTGTPFFKQSKSQVNKLPQIKPA